MSWLSIDRAGPFVDVVVRNPTPGFADPMLGGSTHAKLRGLVDTGADLTMIMGGVPGQLQLMRTGLQEILGVRGMYDQGAHSQCGVFFAELEIAGKCIRCPVYEGGFSTPQMLIGRDVLSHFRIDYDGPGGRFRLS